jgi:hypothetical protein
VLYIQIKRIWSLEHVGAGAQDAALEGRSARVDALATNRWRLTRIADPATTTDSNKTLSISDKQTGGRTEYLKPRQQVVYP